MAEERWHSPPSSRGRAGRVRVVLSMRDALWSGKGRSSLLAVIAIRASWHT
jgi:hypothetical protein